MQDSPSINALSAALDCRFRGQDGHTGWRIGEVFGARARMDEGKRWLGDLSWSTVGFKPQGEKIVSAQPESNSNLPECPEFASVLQDERRPSSLGWLSGFAEILGCLCVGALSFFGGTLRD